MSARRLTTPAPPRTKVGKLPSPRKSLPSLQNAISTTPATQGRRSPVRTTGPKSLPFGKAAVITTGPGEPPAGWSGAFPGGASRDEWVVYWALWKVLRCKGDPRTPPYAGCTVGNKSFKYQQDVGGGRLTRGGQVVDYEVSFNLRTIAVRLMTERWHAAAKREQQIRDIRGKIALARYGRVCDLWTQNFLDDPTGEAVCENVAACLKDREPPDPFTWGFKRVRPAQRPPGE